MPKQGRVLDGTNVDEEIAQLLALLVRFMQPSQTAAIMEMNKVGFTPARIADLLGTTRGTANVTIQQNKNKPKRTSTQAKLKAAPQVSEEDEG